MQKQTKVVFANICEKSGISKFCGCCGPAISENLPEISENLPEIFFS